MAPVILTFLGILDSRASKRELPAWRFVNFLSPNTAELRRMPQIATYRKMRFMKF